MMFLVPELKKSHALEHKKFFAQLKWVGDNKVVVKKLLHSAGIFTDDLSTFPSLKC